MKINYCLAILAIVVVSCSVHEQPRILEVGGNQLPQESASGDIKKDENHCPAPSQAINQENVPMVPDNLQSSPGPGLDALPTLVFPSPSGNKVIILPPPHR